MVIVMKTEKGLEGMFFSSKAIKKSSPTSSRLTVSFVKMPVKSFLFQ